MSHDSPYMLKSKVALESWKIDSVELDKVLIQFMSTDGRTYSKWFWAEQVKNKESFVQIVTDFIKLSII